MKIRYSDFWPGFKPERFILTHIINQLVKEQTKIVTDQNELVDIEIFSSFPIKSPVQKFARRIGFELTNKLKEEYISQATYGYRTNYPDKSLKKIWFSGENKRPPYWHFDLNLSFEKTDISTRNVYFPYWMTRINWGYGESESEIYPTIHDLTKSRNISQKGKSVCVFSSNLEPARELIIDAIEKVIDVDKFGSAFNNRVDSKLETATNYSLQICNENDLYPGYVTEKLQESWMAGNVPVWSGIFPHDHPFNTEAIINVTDLTGKEITDLIEIMSEEEINQKINQPLLRTPITLVDLEKALLKLM